MTAAASTTNRGSAWPLAGPRLAGADTGNGIDVDVGWAKPRSGVPTRLRRGAPTMSRYRRMRIDGGVFFFTVVLADRSSTLLVDQIVRLRRIHESVRKRLPFEVVAVCVLPDHIHAIWALPEHDSNYSLRWSLIKSGFSRGLEVDTVRSPSKSRKRERGVWQRRFWEHTIRDDADLERHVDYIHFNPVKHDYVTRTGDWPYSSFHRYVRDGILASDWAGDTLDLGGNFGE